MEHTNRKNYSTRIEYILLKVSPIMHTTKGGDFDKYLP